MTKDDLTLEQLTDFVAAASGWYESANLTFRQNPGSSVSVSVEICGDKTPVTGHGSDHRTALIVLLQNIEMHHREVLRWHKQRCTKVREILDAHGIYYVKVDL